MSGHARTRSRPSLGLVEMLAGHQASVLSCAVGGLDNEDPSIGPYPRLLLGSRCQQTFLYGRLRSADARHSARVRWRPKIFPASPGLTLVLAPYPQGTEPRIPVAYLDGIYQHGYGVGHFGLHVENVDESVECVSPTRCQDSRRAKGVSRRSLCICRCARRGNHRIPRASPMGGVPRTGRISPLPGALHASKADVMTQTVMSALPPKADMAHLFNHLVGCIQ
jgi:hypothetical protein